MLHIHTYCEWYTEHGAHSKAVCARIAGTSQDLMTAHVGEPVNLRIDRLVLVLQSVFCHSQCASLVRTCGGCI